jgi:nucleotide sugar dehydrogenase
MVARINSLSYHFLWSKNMLGNVGFIGYGVVGKACHHAFRHNIVPIVIDPKYSKVTIQDLKDSNAKLTFVSVNAPTRDDRTVDASAIYDVFQQLADIKYTGLVVLKSTLPPDIVDDLCKKYFIDSTNSELGLLRYIYSPEFVREGHWEDDAVAPQQIIMAGNYQDCKELEVYYRNHSHVRLPRFQYCSYKEASFVKYAINSYLAMKVTFLNQMYQLMVDADGLIQPESWRAFTDMLTADLRIGSTHLDVPGPDGMFGYGGSCLPKDVKAIIGYDKNQRLSVLREVELANTKNRLTGDGYIDIIY